MEGSVRSLDKKASVAGIRCGIPSVIGGHRWERVVPVANIHSQTAKVLPTMLFEKVDSDSVQILFRFRNCVAAKKCRLLRSKHTRSCKA